MNAQIRLLLLLVLCTLLIGCYQNLTASDEQFEMLESSRALQLSAQDSKAPTTSALNAIAASALTMGALPEENPSRHIIYNAEIGVEIDDVRAATKSLQTQILAMKGYIGNLNESLDRMGKLRTNLTVRVPHDAFDAALVAIGSSGKIISKHVYTQDVTDEFVDTTARIRNLQRTEERVLDHLSRTGDLEDIMAVERELSRIRGEVEQAEGRIRYLDHQIAYSTIQISLSETPKRSTVVPAKTFSSGKVLSDAMRTLVSFLRVLWTFIIWLSVWAVIWGPGAVVLYLVVRRSRLATRARGV